MNIQTVAENLRNTIEGKEKYLTQQQLLLESGEPHERIVTFTMVKMLEINIDELKKILADVEQCMADNKEFSTWAHWQANPDRSGGQFTQDEIDNANRW